MATPVTPLNPQRVINGRHCKVFLAGNIFLTWAQSVEARVALERADIVVSGRFGTGYKLIGGAGTGTLNGFHVTSKFRKQIADILRTGDMPDSTYMTFELSDPDQYRVGAGGNVGVPSVEIVKLNGVDFWETALGFDVTDTVKDDFPFTFQDVDWPSIIAPPGVND